MKHPLGPLAFLADELAAADAAHLLRTREAARPGGRASFSSNDYLGFARLPLVGGAATGAGASRLVTGEAPQHAAAERALAAWVGAEDALVFTSGWATNVGVLSSLAREGDLLVSDAWNHASLIDGARLSRARVAVTPHGDIGAVEAALRRSDAERTFVVVEGYYSMDADTPDLRALRAVTEERGAALVVDEAHALGVLGPEGRGACAEAGVVPDVLIGTLGKALGVQGGFAAGSGVLTAWLWNRARSFVFSTGMSPALAETVSARVGHARAAEAERRRVRALAERLRAGLAELGADVRGHGHIVPWVLGDPARATRVAERLRGEGFDVRAIRPPTVPRGTSRIRLTVTAAHAEADVDALLEALQRVSRET